ncbi:hypothetical protein BYT27DRAFT_7256191 [Phlegmacium glaucopus]|nr:hypothetical protein BYT27DRAFT_7256191 [Phlegmacium glaucopus]
MEEGKGEQEGRRGKEAEAEEAREQREAGPTSSLPTVLSTDSPSEHPGIGVVATVSEPVLPSTSTTQVFARQELYYPRNNIVIGSLFAYHLQFLVQLSHLLSVVSPPVTPILLATPTIATCLPKQLVLALSPGEGFIHSFKFQANKTGAEAKRKGDEEEDDGGNVEEQEEEEAEVRSKEVEMGDGEAKMGGREEEEEVGGTKELEAEKGGKEEEDERGSYEGTKELGSSNPSSSRPPRS